MQSVIEQRAFTEERALFRASGVCAKECTFDVGESPFKHSEGACLDACLVRSRYPVWYSKKATVRGCSFFEDARAGFWYTDGLCVSDTLIASPKNFRRSSDIKLENVTFSNDGEALWECDGVDISNVGVHGDYFAMNSKNMTVSGLRLVGKYSFDGVKNVQIRDSHLLTKDAFWNSENVTVYDSTVIGEYLGWNAKNLTLVNCTVESLQGMCYVENLVMKNCKLVNTTLAFEYSTVDVETVGGIDGVYNPTAGTITTDYVRELTVSEGKARIILRDGE